MDKLKTLTKLTFAFTKMYVRNKMALFFTLFFPFIIILIFGILDFGKFSTGKIGLVYEESNSQIVSQVKQTIEKTGNKVEEGTLEEEKQALTNDDRALVLQFVTDKQTGKVNVTGYINKANEDVSQAVFLAIQNALSRIELQMKQVEPMFNIKSEEINVHELRNIDFMVPGVVAMSLMQGGLFGVVGTIVTYREKGILKRLFATPLSKSTFLLANIISRLFISILQVIILLATSYAVFQIKIVGSLFLVALFSVLGSLAFLAIGFAISGFSKTTEAARAIMMPIQMVMMFTSGVYFPREVLPDWLYKITNYLPLTYLADGLRYITTRGYSLADKDLQIAFGGVVVWMFIFVVVAIVTFKWDSN